MGIDTLPEEGRKVHGLVKSKKVGRQEIDEEINRRLSKLEATWRARIRYCKTCNEVLWGVSKSVVPDYCNGKCAGSQRRKPEREKQILQMRQRGETYRAIGETFGITYNRVRQIEFRLNREAREVNNLNNKGE